MSNNSNNTNNTNSILPISAAGMYKYNVADNNTRVLAKLTVDKGQVKEFPVLATEFKRYDRYQVDCSIDGKAYISGAGGSITTGTIALLDGFITQCAADGKSSTTTDGGALKHFGKLQQNNKIVIELFASDAVKPDVKFSGVITGTELRTELVEGMPLHVIRLTVIGGLS